MFPKLTGLELDAIPGVAAVPDTGTFGLANSAAGSTFSVFPSLVNFQTRNLGFMK